MHGIKHSFFSWRVVFPCDHVIFLFQETELIDKAEEEEGADEEDSGKDATEEAIKAQAEVESANIPIVDDDKDQVCMCRDSKILIFGYITDTDYCAFCLTKKGIWKTPVSSSLF